MPTPQPFKSPLPSVRNSSCFVPMASLSVVMVSSFHVSLTGGIVESDDVDVLIWCVANARQADDALLYSWRKRNFTSQLKCSLLNQRVGAPVSISKWHGGRVSHLDQSYLWRRVVWSTLTSFVHAVFLNADNQALFSKTRGTPCCCPSFCRSLDPTTFVVASGRIWRAPSL